MLKTEYIRETVEHLLKEETLSVTLAAEGNMEQFKAGDEIMLAQNNGRFCLLDEQGHIIPAEICANVPLEEALTLSLVKAEFCIRKAAGNVFKADMKYPYSLVHHGQREWCYLH